MEIKPVSFKTIGVYPSADLTPSCWLPHAFLTCVTSVESGSSSVFTIGFSETLIAKTGVWMELVGNGTPKIEDNVQPCWPHCPGISSTSWGSATINQKDGHRAVGSSKVLLSRCPWPAPWPESTLVFTGPAAAGDHTDVSRYIATWVHYDVWPVLPSRDMSGSKDLWKLESVLISVDCVANEGHADICGLCFCLKPGRYPCAGQPLGAILMPVVFAATWVHGDVWSGLPLGAMPGSEVLLQLGSVLMSVAHVITDGHAGVYVSPAA
ncbi:hypothetical protein H671_6g16517 [Cricetulus griseus]|nr:hypothetical protein H671_6g16517 [Cricetulus griseus]